MKRPQTGGEHKLKRKEKGKRENRQEIEEKKMCERENNA